MKGLGRGLDQLIGIDNIIDNSEQSGILEVNIFDIDPNLEQPRKKFDEEKLNELANSIKEHGIIQPIVVAKLGDRYRIIAGERRWRAAKIANLSRVPIIIKELDENLELQISLIENLQREDLNSIEEAEAYKLIMEKFKLTQEQLAGKIGKSRPYIANILRLLNLDERVKSFLIEGKISYGHAKTILSLDNKEKQYILSEKVILEELSVRQVEKIIQDINKENIDESKLEDKEENAKSKKENQKDYFIKEIENNLANIFNTKVSIVSGKKKSKIEIEYYSKDDLERILENLNKLT